MESTEHGEHNCLFLLTIAAAAYCGIMKPEFKPKELATRNSGVLRSPAIKRYTRLSEMLQFGDSDAQRNLIPELAVRRGSYHRNNQIIFHENSRVVGYRVDFPFNDRCHVSHGIFHSPVYLRHTTERVRVLHVSLFHFLEF